MRFSAAQYKILLIAWSLVLVTLYIALWFMGTTDLALVASFFVIIPMQLTCLAYFAGGGVLLAMWLFGGRQQNHRDYALIMLLAASLFAFLLRDTSLLPIVTN